MTRIIHAGQLLSADATCPTGKKLVGGGYVLLGTNPPPNELSVLMSHPVNNTMWRVTVHNTGTRSLHYLVNAICVTG